LNNPNSNYSGNLGGGSPSQYSFTQKNSY
jgi:hypothetical protein